MLRSHTWEKRVGGSGVLLFQCVDAIVRENRSWICYDLPRSRYDHMNEEKIGAGIDRTSVCKSDQWFLLSRHHVLDVLAFSKDGTRETCVPFIVSVKGDSSFVLYFFGSGLWRSFATVTGSDEWYFASALAQLGHLSLQRLHLQVRGGCVSGGAKQSKKRVSDGPCSGKDPETSGSAGTTVRNQDAGQTTCRRRRRHDRSGGKGTGYGLKCNAGMGKTEAKTFICVPLSQDRLWLSDG